MSDFVVRADDDKSDKAAEIEATLKADAERKKADAEKARADAEEANENVSKLLDMCTKLTDAVSGFGARLDAIEAKKADEDVELGEDGKPKEPTVNQDSNKGGDPDPNALADAQLRCDKVASNFGLSAPPPMSGESLLLYRRRLLRDFQSHSPSFKDVDLHAIPDAMFAAAEQVIYADAAEASKNPQVAEGRLQARTRTVGGHTFTEFYGDPKTWMSSHAPTGQAVVAFGSTTKK